MNRVLARSRQPISEFKSMTMPSRESVWNLSRIRLWFLCPSCCEIIWCVQRSFESKEIICKIRAKTILLNKSTTPRQPPRWRPPTPKANPRTRKTRRLYAFTASYCMRPKSSRSEERMRKIKRVHSSIEYITKVGKTRKCYFLYLSPQNFVHLWPWELVRRICCRQSAPLLHPQCLHCHYGFTCHCLWLIRFKFLDTATSFRQLHLLLFITDLRSCCELICSGSLQLILQAQVHFRSHLQFVLRSADLLNPNRILPRGCIAYTWSNLFMITHKHLLLKIRPRVWAVNSRRQYNTFPTEIAQLFHSSIPIQAACGYLQPSGRRSILYFKGYPTKFHSNLSSSEISLIPQMIAQHPFWETKHHPLQNLHFEPYLAIVHASCQLLVSDTRLALPIETAYKASHNTSDLSNQPRIWTFTLVVHHSSSLALSQTKSLIHSLTICFSAGMIG